MASGPRRAASLPHLASVVLAITVATIGMLTPSAAGTALAAGTLRIKADASYDLDPGAGRVHVAVDFDLTNVKPSTGTTFFFYTSVFFAVQPEATNIRVADAAGPLSVSTTTRRFFTRVDINLRSNLLYLQTASFTLSYDLVGGAPRSKSGVRINRAFSTFGVWAWGDAGRSRVEVRIPDGYDVETDGDALPTEASGRGQVLEAEPERPRTFFAVVSADDQGAYDTDRVSVDGGIELVVRSWPDDDRWTRAVTGTLRDGMPELVELIGLDWPVTHDLQVRERYTPALEGYAGIFLGPDEGIEVGEDLDGLTIVHEASHAWFNESLFLERWVYEGLAEEYAWRTQKLLGKDAGFGPKEPAAVDPGRAPLADWGYPQAIRDQVTDDLERYGYEASFWVVHLVAQGAGLDGMRAVFDAAEEHRIAYVGAPAPETVPGQSNWRHFVDLAQPIAEPDSPEVETALEELVVTSADRSVIERRHAARDAYRQLVEAGGGWLPPYLVRRPMSGWSFDTAEDAIEEATAVLDRRDEISAAAAELGLAPDDALKSAYENANTDFAAADDIADRELEALTAIAGAKATASAPVDLLAQVGLLGETPPSEAYAAAGSAFERGDLDLAIASAASVTSLLAGAAAAGQQRLLVAGIVAVGLLVLLAAFVLVRRRGRPRRSGAAPAVAAAASSRPASEWPTEDLLAPRPVTPPEPAWWLPTRSSADARTTDPATLAADPDPSPPTASAPDLEGETGTGESPDA